MNPKHINTIIFDFDRTLCSGRYFAPLGQDALDAIGRLVFGAESPKWADPWMRGDLTSQDIAQHLSHHLPHSPEEVLAALHDGCSHMPLNPAVYDFARQARSAGLRTALVTANTDVFTHVVVPAHNLDARFDLILNTADHHTLDKAVLWRKAFATFGPSHSFSSALLIEDNPNMVALFESLGGWAYRYENDKALLAWLKDTQFAEQTRNNA